VFLLGGRTLIPAATLEEAVMAVSDDLRSLSRRAREAEERVAVAKTQARDRLEHAVEQAHQNTQKMAEKLRSDTAAATDRTESWGEDVQQSWSRHLAEVREKIDARKARHDATVAEQYAQEADRYAAFAIDYAYSAIENAEYAVLDAILTRTDADLAAQEST
jgi:hypothetical protein